MSGKIAWHNRRLSAKPTSIVTSRRQKKLLNKTVYYFLIKEIKALKNIFNNQFKSHTFLINFNTIMTIMILRSLDQDRRSDNFQIPGKKNFIMLNEKEKQPHSSCENIHQLHLV